MKSLQEQLAIYQNQPNQPITKITHYLGIPAVVIALLILLNWFSLDIFTRWHISFAWLFVIATLIYYFFLQWRLALAATVVLFIVTLLVTWLAPEAPTKVSIIIFFILLVGGGTLQFFTGRYTDAVKDNLAFLIIMPLFPIIELLKALKLNEKVGL